MLPTIVFSRLVATGKLERGARGIYGLPNRNLSEHRSLAEVCLRVPHGLVRMSGPSLTERIEPRLIDGVKVPIFIAAKTVAARQVAQDPRPHAAGRLSSIGANPSLTV